MGKRSCDEVAKPVLEALSASPEKGMSIQDVSKEAKVSWESARKYLELFVALNIVRKSEESGKPLYQKAGPATSDTLFSIPISGEHRATIEKIYGTIKEIWPTVSNNPLSKTVVQKIAVDFMEGHRPEVPRVWYKFGQMLLLLYKQEKEYTAQLTETHEIESLKKICYEYANLKASYKIRRHQYEKKNKKLYLVKEDLYYWLSHKDFQDGMTKQMVRGLLNQFAVMSGRRDDSEVSAIIEEFCSITLSIFRNSPNGKLKDAKPAICQAFESVWDLVAIDELRTSLKKFYGPELVDDYLTNAVEAVKETTIESLESLQEVEPSFAVADDEASKKLSNLMGSARRLNPEEQAERENELEGIKPSEIFRKFNLNA